MKRLSSLHEQRAADKERSRQRDAQALAAGAVSPEQLRRENGRFVFAHIRVDLKSGTSVR